MRVSILATLLYSFFVATPLFAQTTPSAAPREAVTTIATAIAEYGTPLYDDTLKHFPYVNPEAPKGGKVVLGAAGSFDNLNALTFKGDLATGLALTQDSLMTGSGDELMSAYPLIATQVEMAADKSFAIFTLNPLATWDDGTPITATDFETSLNLIKADPPTNPFYASFFSEVSKATVINPTQIRFDFTSRGKMRPIMAVATSLPPMHTAWAKNRDFSQPSLDIMPSSGAYKITDIQPGQSMSFTRRNDYWAQNLPTVIGTNNFDVIRYDYFRDDGVMFEAFAGGKIDFWNENRAQRWTQIYDTLPAVKSGQIQRLAIPDDTPEGTQGFFFNTRRPQFADRNVRQALILLFDFENVQKRLLFGQYKRAQNWFLKGDFGSKALPQGKELALLEPFRDQLPAELFTSEYKAPTSDGTGRDRANIARALAILQIAGWKNVNGVLVNAKNESFRVEFLEQAGGNMQRIMQPYVEALKQVGIDATIRSVDSAQYKSRLDNYDFDVISVKSNFFPPPGSELRSYYGSKAGKNPGEGNWSGIDSPVVDALIEDVIAANDYDSLTAATQALDRVLNWGLYYVPHWYNPDKWLAWQNRFAYPATKPRYGTGYPGTWWVKETQTAATALTTPAADTPAKNTDWVKFVLALLAGAVLGIIAMRGKKAGKEKA